MSSFSPRQFPAFEKIDDRTYDNGGRVADVVVGTAQSGLHVVLCAVRFLRSGTGCGRGRYVRIVPSVVRVKYVAVPVAEDSLYGSGSDVYS